MARPQLYIANKNYSSWSMRPWLLMRHHGLDFDEVMVRLDDMDAASPFKRRLAAVTPAGRVPVYVDGDLAVWDTLAIAETLAERHPELPLWPRDAARRARARSLCAEMHAGFGALRQRFPMNVEADLTTVGPRVLREHADAAADLARVAAAWHDALAAGGGPFLFGDAFGIADAYFAPVVSRIRTYGLPLAGAAADWAERVWALPAVAQWVGEAVQEHAFLAADEPYREAPAATAPPAPQR